MEPLAPGTEDEAPSITKKERERLLSIQAWIHSVGRFENVFEVEFRNGVEQWYCKVCECPVMGRAFHHEIGKRHTLNMDAAEKYGRPSTQHQQEQAPSGNDYAKKQQQPFESSALNVAPGQPVPPGFEGEGEVTKVAEIQEKLDKFRSSPVLGLEYILELQNYDAEPSYLCLLCGKKGDPRTVIAHLISFNHLLAYLQIHYPKSYGALYPYTTKTYKKPYMETINKIAEAIEYKYGRLMPHLIDADVFEQRKDQIYAMVHGGPHFSDRNGDSFEHLVDRDEFQRYAVEVAKCDEKNAPLFATETTTTTTGAATKRSPSPPKVKKPKKPKTTTGPTTQAATAARRKSLSSVSSISSDDEFSLARMSPKTALEWRKLNNDSFERHRVSPKSALETRKKTNDSFDRNKPWYARRSQSPLFKRFARQQSPPSPTKSKEKQPPTTATFRPVIYQRKRGDSSWPWDRPDYARKSDINSTAPSAKGVFTKMDEFKRLSNAIESDLERQLKQHKMHPEKHPHYNDEWKIFWNKRYKELQGEGRDTTKYDFKPEWIVYWNKRIIEMQKDELKKQVDALRKRLGLMQQSEPQPISFKIGPQKKGKNVNRKPTPCAAQEDQQSDDVIVIDDKEEGSRSPWESESPKRSSSNKASKRRSRSRSRSRDRQRVRRSRSRSSLRRTRRSPSPYSRRRRSRSRSSSLNSRRLSRRSSSNTRNSRNSRSKRSSSRDRRSISRSARRHRSRSASPPPKARNRSHERSWERDISAHIEQRHKDKDVILVRESVLKKPVSPEPLEIEDFSEVNIVAVLRLLTAVEDKLGSLGPKVVDMLAAALAMEKKLPNSSEELLDVEANCVLFETIKEKLKGQLHANLVHYNQEKAIKMAVTKIATLLHLAATNKEKKKEAASKVMAAIDKSAIAKQIATALVLQGKTDVTQAELEQLVNAVVQMAEVSKSTSTVVSTATFLDILNSKNSLQANSKSTTSVVKAKEPPAAAAADVDVNKTTANVTTPVTNVEETPKDAMDGLSDTDLQTLLQNFKDLSAEEQHGLITYLKKMEAKEPARVETLRKFVNLSSNAEESATTVTDGGNKTTGAGETKERALSPFSMKLNESQQLQRQPMKEQTPKKLDQVAEKSGDPDPWEEKEVEQENEKKKPSGISEVFKQTDKIDSDDDDYTFEDVFKAANKNVEAKMAAEQQEQQKEQKKNTQENVSNLIANIMVSLASKTSGASSNVGAVNVAKFASTTSVTTKVSEFSGGDFSKSSINNDLNRSSTNDFNRNSMSDHSRASSDNFKTTLNDKSATNEEFNFNRVTPTNSNSALPGLQLMQPHQQQAPQQSQQNVNRVFNTNVSGNSANLSGNSANLSGNSANLSGNSANYGRMPMNDAGPNYASYQGQSSSYQQNHQFMANYNSNRQPQSLQVRQQQHLPQQQQFNAPLSSGSSNDFSSNDFMLSPRKFNQMSHNPQQYPQQQQPQLHSQQQQQQQFQNRNQQQFPNQQCFNQQQQFPNQRAPFNNNRNFMTNNNQSNNVNNINPRNSYFNNNNGSNYGNRW